MIRPGPLLPGDMLVKNPAARPERLEPHLVIAVTQEGKTVTVHFLSRRGVSKDVFDQELLLHQDERGVSYVDERFYENVGWLNVRCMQEEK